MNPITVFSKPWNEPIHKLGERLMALGVDGLELPVRDGYPVNPENAASELPRAVDMLRSFDLAVHSIAAEVSVPMIVACSDAGVPTIRVCEGISLRRGYHASVAEIKKEYERILPYLERHGVTIGLQNHSGHYIGSAAAIMDVVAEFDPKRVGAVLDVAHCGLDGEPEELAIDVVWSHLCMVNLKNAIRTQSGVNDDGEALWRVQWTSGQDGYASWSKTISNLLERGYRGPYCLTAEYTRPASGSHRGEDWLTPLVKEDLRYARKLLGR